jgi:hypothetical protein
VHATAVIEMMIFQLNRTDRRSSRDILKLDSKKIPIRTHQNRFVFRVQIAVSFIPSHQSLISAKEMLAA